MTEFTPWSALLGGVLIGLAAVGMMALEGRIAGISGIASRLLPPWPDAAWKGRLGFVLGLVAAPLAAWLATGDAPAQSVPGNLPLMALAGLLVGFGAVLGHGCTSGHGVCGLARFSPRSLAAVLTFMITGFLTVALMRHGLGS
ncbi:YeeE/YedE family protein [Teichococcus aestuarii]|uniref:Uncharacterized protein n=1 Tax=Teichococcus aestuarii TaxID=568898 RepID=A0A2U1V344_9PROT|nr:YeeE/YedE thiosulfate transporter family protein [Pseudoroseomonas aestuarii]PWC28337.1 hypothetical protein CR165_13715 [Pseudoroseomonas aestuarii]